MTVPMRTTMARMESSSARVLADAAATAAGAVVESTFSSAFGVQAATSNATAAVRQRMRSSVVRGCVRHGGTANVRRNETGRHVGGPSRRSDGYRLFGLLGRLHVPLVAALQAPTIRAARLIGFRLGADVAALGADLGHRLVPHDEVAVGVVLAAVEHLAARLRAAL